MSAEVLYPLLSKLQSVPCPIELILLEFKELLGGGGKHSHSWLLLLHSCYSRFQGNA